MFVFSLLLGALIMFLGLGYTKSWFRAAVMLVVLPGVFLIPRGNATGFLLPLFLPHFWLAVGFTFAVRWVAPRLEVRPRDWMLAAHAPRHRAQRSIGPSASRGASAAADILGQPLSGWGVIPSAIT